MTCKEKYMKEHPNMSEDDFDAILGFECPNEHYKQMPDPESCGHITCIDCWNREIPEKVVEKFNEIGNVHALPPEQIRAVIKDSGDRTEFPSGAVRDMREGKGRCDLMPLEVCARVFSDPVLNPTGYDMNLSDIRKFQETGKTCYLYYVLRRFANEAFHDFETMLLEVAKHFEEGAKKYGPDNWRKSIPKYCYIDSAVRHYLKWRRGDNDEPHNRAFCWNLMCCIWEVDYGEEYRKNNKE